MHRLQIRRKQAAGAEEKPAKEEEGEAKEGAEEGEEKEGEEEGVEVSQPEDAAEKEADAVADEVADGIHDEEEEGEGDEKKDNGPDAQPAAPVQAKVQLKGKGPPTPTDAKYRSADDLLGANLGDLDDYTRNQVDWHKDPSIKGDNHKNLRKLLEFAREGNLLNGCKKMNVRELIDSKLTSDVRKHLNTYADAIKGAIPTVELESTDKLDVALKQGKALDRLNAEVGGATMKHIMKKEKLNAFIDNGRVEPFIQYVKISQPILSAAGESDDATKDEIFSFQKLHDGGDPNRFRGTVKHVRNYHHFQNDALKKLEENEPQKNDPAKSGQQFNLILHSGLDHNAAFHQDPNMTNAITTGFTILVEGVKSIGEIQGQLQPLAQQYGGGKIGQVMICGHGGPTGMQLAGDVGIKDDKVEEKEDSLEIGQDPNDPEAAKKKQEETDAFLNELLANMSNDPKDPGRIVLNACLTNAMPDSPALPADKDEAKKTILANPSLAKHLQDLAANKKDDKGAGMNVDVKGSNASFGEVALNEPGNESKFDIVDKDAGDLLTSSKLDYVEKGIEPEGSIRAVLQAWAEDQGKCLAAIDKRLAVSNDPGWAETLIRTMYKLVKADPDNGAQINTLCSKIRNFADAYGEAECKVENLWPADADYASKIFPALAGTTEWNDAANKHVPLVFFQKWMEFEAGKKKDFLAALDGYGTPNAAAKFIDKKFLQGLGVPGLIGSAKSAPSKAAIKLAFIMLVKYSDPDAKTFVKDLMDANGGKLTAFTDEMTDLGTEPDIIALVKPPDAAPDADDDSPDSANADLDGDKKNETRIEPFIKEGKAKTAVRVRKQPDLDAKIIRTIYPGDPVAIIGKKDDWYAVEDGKSTAFIFAEYVEVT